MAIQERKAAVVGCGFVGAASAFALMQSGLFNELVLLDANRAKAEGEALDISHGLLYAKPMQIYAGDYDDLCDAGIIIVTAGAGQKPGETRLDLVKKNIAIFRQIIPEIARRNREAVMIIVANPVDVLTFAAQKLSGYPENRVIGTGTVLDTARLRYLLGEHLQVDSRTVSAFIIGEHGDSEIAVWSSAAVGGTPLHDFCELRGHFDHEAAMEHIADGVRRAAYEIIERKGATYFGIAMSVVRVCEAIVRDEHSILPVSVLRHGEYGVQDVALSLPMVVGRGGAQDTVPLPLSPQERTALLHSAQTLKEVLHSSFCE